MRCPSCGEEASAADRFCGSCGQDLGDTQASPAVPEQQETALVKQEDTPEVVELADVLEPLDEAEAAGEESPRASREAEGGDVTKLPRAKPRSKSRAKTAWIVVAVVVVALICFCCIATVLMFGLVEASASATGNVPSFEVPWN